MQLSGWLFALVSRENLRNFKTNWFSVGKGTKILRKIISKSESGENLFKWN